MLQWTGGSRRKVSTSRKSTLKRQKQYFEQKRRQQQNQQTGPGSTFEGESSTWARHQNQNQNPNQNRSLDVLSLLNLSTNRSEPRGSESLMVINVEAVKDSPIKLGNNTASPRVNEAGRVMAHRAENVSLQKLVRTPRDSSKSAHIDTKMKLNSDRSSIHQVFCPPEFSLFDLLDGDGPNGETEGSPPHEAHVAFSVEGLGKVGAETPVRSPQQPNRCDLYGFSSPLNPKRWLKSQKSLNSVLDDIQHEMEPILQDIEIPLSGSSTGFAARIRDSSKKINKTPSAPRHYNDFNGFTSKRWSSSNDLIPFNNCEIDLEDMWDKPISSGTDFLLEGDYAMSPKKWHQNHSCAIDFLQFENDYMGNYAFENLRLQKKRNAKLVSEDFDILGSPFLVNQTLEDYDTKITKERRKHHGRRTNFNFNVLSIQPDSSLLSEQSSSSSAVKGEVVNISPSKSRARHRRNLGNAFAGPDTAFRDEHIPMKGKYFSDRNVKREEGSLPEQRKSTWGAEIFPVQEQTGRCDSPLSEGDKLTRGNLGFGGLPSTSATKLEAVGFEPLITETFGAYAVSKPEGHGGLLKHSVSGCFFAEKFVFRQTPNHIPSYNTPSCSKVEFRTREHEYKPDSPGFELEAVPMGFYHGENTIRDISTSVHKEEKNGSNNEGRSETRTEILYDNDAEKIDGLEYNEVKDIASEASSSVKIRDRSE